MKFTLIVALLVTLATVLLVCSATPTTAAAECKADSDCVPSTCCHAPVCVSKEKAPTNCASELCTADCQPFTLDCGGSCSCSAAEGKCVANYKSQGGDNQAAAYHGKRKRYGYDRVANKDLHNWLLKRRGHG